MVLKPVPAARPINQVPPIQVHTKVQCLTVWSGGLVVWWSGEACPASWAVRQQQYLPTLGT